MKKKLLDLSGKIDQILIEVLFFVSQTADSLNIPFFVIGATARDIIMNIAYDIESERATADLDLGVQVENWEMYDKLRTALVATGKFRADREPQRLKYNEELPMDIVPFGLIANGKSLISWPPHHETAMTTEGFNDAYADAISVRLRNEPVFQIDFASLCGIAVLKIFAWSERYPERKKDAMDLDYVMRNYAYAGNEERIYAEEMDILEMMVEFESEYASAILLGRDMAKMMQNKTRQKMLEIIEQQIGTRNRYRLVEDMIAHPAFFEEKFEKKLKMIEYFAKGLKTGR